MIKTLKKFSKKSLAILIALLMIISVMPFTPPVSVEAADKTAADYQTEIDTIFAKIGTTGYTAKNPEAADKSYSSSTTFGGGDEMSNVLYTYGVGSDAAHITKSSARIDGGAKYGPVVFLYDGGKMAVPVQFYGQKTHATSKRYLESALPTNAGYSMAHNWHNSTDKSPGYHSGTGKTFAYSDSNPEKKSANVETDYVAYFSNTLYFTGTLDDSTPYRSDYITWKWYWSGYNTLVNTQYKTGNSTFTLNNDANNVAKSGNPSINIVNYMPIKNILSTVKKDYETVKANVASNSNYYTEASLTNYYKLVHDVVSLDPNSYNYASDATGQAKKAGDDIAKAADAYTKSRLSGLVRQYGVTFVKKDKTSTTKYYAANTAANAVTKPANTALKKKDDTSHYTYSWPAVSAVTADATYEEVENTVNHSYTDSVTTDPTCTTAGVTTHTCACGYSYTTNKPDATGHKEGTPVEENRVNATCTTDGSYDLVVRCTVCKEELSRETKTIKKLGHSFTNYVQTVAPTCTKVGTETATCDRCGATDTQDIEINPNNHNYGEWVDNEDGSTHTKTCSYNNEHKVTEKHNIQNGVCTDCHYVAKVTITFVDENDKVIGSKEYTIGEAVTAPKLPDKTIVYADNSQHKETTYSWNETPQETATKAATYKRVKTELTVDCSNQLKEKGETSDTWYCTVCGHEYKRDVIDMSALKENITVLETAVNVDDAAYKYKATALADAKKTLDEAKAYVVNDNNRYASIEDVNDISTRAGTAYTVLTTTGLAKYSQTFKIKKYDGNGTITDIATFTEGYENLAYGSTVEFSKYTIPPIEDESSTLNGLPMYAVYKWVKIVNGAEEKLGTTDVQISDVVKGEATYICYVLPFKATNETQTTTRVRYLDKSGHTIYFDTATVGKPYTRKSTSIAPLIPYYECTGWELVFGDETNVGTRELVYQARYSYSDSNVNVCEIVGLGDVKVNGAERCSAIYDSKVVLTGATKYAFCDADGKKIISYINEDYIYTPRVNETVYIIAVEEATTATTAITGSFVQKDVGTLNDGRTYHNLYVNAQFYLPEDASAVEAGLVLSKSKSTADELQIGKENVTKLVSTSQSPNHEYSMAMSFANDGKVHARSYLIYVDKSGTTHTVYSAVKTIEYKA